jgi:hypothetical protein
MRPCLARQHLNPPSPGALSSPLCRPCHSPVRANPQHGLKSPQTHTRRADGSATLTGTRQRRTVRSPKSLTEPIYDAVGEYARLAVGSTPVTISIIFADGTRLTLEGGSRDYRAPPPEIPTPPVPPKAWPPNTGWSHDGERFSFDSEVFALGGRPGEVLRLLIETGSPCDLETMRREVWTDYPCEDAVIRMAISRLRRSLKEILSLPDDFDPIEAEGSTYRIKPI